VTALAIYTTFLVFVICYLLITLSRTTEELNKVEDDLSRAKADAEEARDMVSELSEERMERRGH
tara:strand:- start:15737 stop:15928 length:192 start_codon:yes stop_codon:yes gene_type:complete